MQRKHVFVKINVDVETRRMARKLAAEMNIPLNKAIRQALEMMDPQSAKMFNERKRTNGGFNIDFSF